VIPNFGDAAAAKLCHPFIVPQQVFVHAGAHLVALAAPFGELLFILGRTFAGFLFFLFDLGRFCYQFRLCRLYLLIAGVGIHHQLENFIFGGGDFFFRELDLVQQSFVLLVGFNVKRLIAILGNLSPEVGDGSVVLAAAASSALTAA